MIYNPYIVVPVATWAVAQVAKFGIAAIRGRIDFRYLYASGGMPSVHSAVMSSLVVTAYLVDGPANHLFGFVLIIALVVIYDSLGVRRSSGEQAVVLNMLLENLERNRFKLDAPPTRLREVLGHQPREVLVGAITGIVLAGLFNYERLGNLAVFLQKVPVKYELWSYVAIFGVIIVAGMSSKFLLGRQFPKSKAMKKFRNNVFVASQTIGWVGIVFCALIFERASYLAWRMWPLVLLAGGIFWAASIATGSGRSLKVELAAEANHSRKMKWFKISRKSR